MRKWLKNLNCYLINILLHKKYPICQIRICILPLGVAGLSVAEDDPEVMHEVAALFASVITCRGALGGEAKIESAEAVEAEMAAEAEA